MARSLASAFENGVEPSALKAEEAIKLVLQFVQSSLNSFDGTSDGERGNGSRQGFSGFGEVDRGCRLSTCRLFWFWGSNGQEPFLLADLSDFNLGGLMSKTELWVSKRFAWVGSVFLSVMSC